MDGQIQPARVRPSRGVGALSTRVRVIQKREGAAALRFFKSILLISILVTCSLGSQVQFPPDTWAQSMGVSVSGVRRDLRVVWPYEAGESIESSAAISNGVVYVGSQSGELTALNLSNGSVRWKYKATGPIGESSPCVANGVVYIGDLNGTVHAVRASDGRAVWTFKTNGEVKSSPVVVGDRLLIGSYDEHLYCLGAANGSLIWKFRTQGPVHCTAGVSNGVAHIAGCDETFRAIRITDGRELYHVASGAYTGASPA